MLVHAMTRHVHIATTTTHVHVVHIHIVIAHVSIISMRSVVHRHNVTTAAVMPHSHLVLLVSGLLCRDEVHAAFRTLPRLILPHLWMHGTGIDLGFVRL